MTAKLKKIGPSDSKVSAWHPKTCLSDYFFDKSELNRRAYLFTHGLTPLNAMDVTGPQENLKIFSIRDKA